jgi:hypothetical protein
MSPRPALLLFLLAVPFSSSQITGAQQDPPKGAPKPADQPLAVTAELSTTPAPECGSSQALLLQFHYSGDKPLRGYLVRLVALNAAHRAPVEQTVHEIRDSRDQMIVPGADWTRTVCSSISLAPSQSVTTIVDFLKFPDGSAWGPMHLPESHELIGVMDGQDFAVKTTDLERYVSPLSPDTTPIPEEHLQFQTIGPLRFLSGIYHDPKNKECLAVEATNAGDAPIRAFVFTESFFDSATGARLRRVATKKLETHGNSTHYLLPGGTWLCDTRKFSYSSDGSLANYRITLDFVVFADGSTYGPKQSRESDEVLGMLRGIDAQSNPSLHTHQPPTN